MAFYCSVGCDVLCLVPFTLHVHVFRFSLVVAYHCWQFFYAVLGWFWCHCMCITMHDPLVMCTRVSLGLLLSQ